MIASFAGATFTIGIVIATIGALFVLFPPKKINWIYGYRTLSAMRTTETWAFANRYAANLLFLVGLSAIGIGILSFFIPFLKEKGAIAGVIVISLAMVAVIFLTEKALRRTFDKNGHPLAN